MCMCSTWFNVLHMSKMIQIRHVPDDLHLLFKVRAAKQGKSLSDYLLMELYRLAELPTFEEWLERLDSRSSVNPDISSAELIRQDRDAR